MNKKTKKEQIIKDLTFLMGKKRDIEDSTDYQADSIEQAGSRFTAIALRWVGKGKEVTKLYSDEYEALSEVMLLPLTHSAWGEQLKDGKWVKFYTNVYSPYIKNMNSKITNLQDELSNM